MNSLWLSLAVAATAFADLSNPPLLSYSTYLTGSKGSYGHGVAFDSAGNAYISGYAISQDFPFTLPPLGPPSSGPACCGYIAKLNPTGTALIWSVRLNAPSAGPIALDAAGSIYVLGTSRRSDNSIASWAVTKITPSADRIVYSTLIPAEEAAFAVDPGGNVYVTGWAGPGFPTTPGAYLMQLATGDDAFVVKLNPAGTIVYATYTGMTGQGNAIAPDSQGNVWITGAMDNGPAFVAKLDSAGAKLLFSKQFGGGEAFEVSIPSTGLGIVVDSTDAAYAVGQSGLGVLTTPGSLEPLGPADAAPFFETGYLVKFNPSGDVVYGTYVGEDQQSAPSVAVDASGNAYVGLNGTYFINNAYPACVGNGASSIIVISADGSKIISSKLNFPSSIEAFVLDPTGGAYIVGTTYTSEFLTTPQALQTQGPSAQSAFVAKFDFSTPAGIELTCLVNAASPYSWGEVAPGELVTLFGLNFTPDADLKVTFDGRPAPPTYAGATQINAVVPFEVSDAPGSSTLVSVESGGQTFGPVKLPVAPAQPGLFAAILNQDGTLNSGANPAPAGSVVAVYMTGVGEYKQRIADGSLGPLEPPFPSPVLGVSATIHGEQAQVLFVGQAPGLIAGVVQVNLRIPDDAASGMATLVVYVGNYPSISQGPNLAIQ